MNKIIIDKDDTLDLKNNVLNLEINCSNLTLNISGKVLINEFNKRNNDNTSIIINLANNSELLYNRFLDISNMNTTITINQENNSSVEFNYSIIAHDKGKLTMKSNVIGNNNKTSIKVKAITKDFGSLVLGCTTDNKDNTTNNELLESLKILMLNEEESIIIPDLLVASNEVEVNHAATISGIKEDELFYLNSKGISTEEAKRLISTGFIINNLNISSKQQKELEGILNE
jgi:hypothetical protein